MTPGTLLYAAAASSGSNAANWALVWIAVATMAAGGLLWLGRLAGRQAKKARHVTARFRQVLGDFLGYPARPGFPAVPGVMEQLQALAETLGAHGEELAKVRAQVLPNGGSSLRDAVDDVARDLAGVKDDVAGVKGDVSRMAGQSVAYEDARAERDRSRYPGEPPDGTKPK